MLRSTPQFANLPRIVRRTVGARGMGAAWQPAIPLLKTMGEAPTIRPGLPLAIAIPLTTFGYAEHPRSCPPVSNRKRSTVLKLRT